MNRRFFICSLSVLTIVLIQICLDRVSPAFAQGSSNKTVSNWNPGHYILVLGGITSPIKRVLEAPKSPFLGVQKTYSWKSLEPVDGGPLALDEIKNDLKYLSSKGKYLVIQIQMKSFNGQPPNYPNWLTQKRASQRPDGGFYRCYARDKDTSIPTTWDPKTSWYIRRFYNRLGNALSRMPEATRALEAVNISESGVLKYDELTDMTKKGLVFPFDQNKYIYHLVFCAQTLNQSCANTSVIQYVNWSGPWGGTQNMATNRVDEICKRLAAYGIGIGGPDLVLASNATIGAPLNKYVYPSYRRQKGAVVLGAACQPRTFATYKGGNWNAYIQQIFDLSRRGDGGTSGSTSLELNYLFWTSYPDRLDNIEAVLNKPGSGWVGQRHRGMVAKPPVSTKVFKK